MYKLATGRQEDLHVAGQVPCPSPPITYEHLQLHSLDPPQMLLSPQPHTRLFAPFELSPVRLMTPTRPNFSCPKLSHTSAYVLAGVVYCSIGSLEVLIPPGTPLYGWQS